MGCRFRQPEYHHRDAQGYGNKFDYNAELGLFELGLFELGKVLPEGMSFPYDFGFVPSTKAQDGDPLDVLVLMDEPGFPGCKVCCRLIGVIEGEQSSKGGETVRNDRLIAVANECLTIATRSLKKLPGSLVEEIGHFFTSYHGLDGKEFKILGAHGPHKAEKLVRDGASRFRKQSQERAQRNGQLAR
jgi:inorganic pyrophosphatase